MSTFMFSTAILQRMKKRVPLIMGIISGSSMSTDWQKSPEEETFSITSADLHR